MRTEINKFSNFTTVVDDIEIHFIHEKGSGSNPTPLLLMHGWPGSVVEFLHIIEKLAHPEKFGGNIRRCDLMLLFLLYLALDFQVDRLNQLVQEKWQLS